MYSASYFRNDNNFFVRSALKSLWSLSLLWTFLLWSLSRRKMNRHRCFGSLKERFVIGSVPCIHGPLCAMVDACKIVFQMDSARCLYSYLNVVSESEIDAAECRPLNFTPQYSRWRTVWPDRLDKRIVVPSFVIGFQVLALLYYERKSIRRLPDLTSLMSPPRLVSGNQATLFRMQQHGKNGRKELPARTQSRLRKLQEKMTMSSWWNVRLDGTGFVRLRAQGYGRSAFEPHWFLCTTERGKPALLVAFHLFSARLLVFDLF